jgi:hypothetical protein
MHWKGKLFYYLFFSSKTNFKTKNKTPMVPVALKKNTKTFGSQKGLQIKTLLKQRELKQPIALYCFQEMSEM